MTALLSGPTKAAALASAGATGRAGFTAVLFYTRVSQDKSGRERSPHEQYDDLKAEADRNQWREAGHISEVKGASRHTKGVRKTWAQVLDRIAAGGVDILMVWEPSRLTRNLREALDFCDLCERTGTRFHYYGRTWDLADPYDRAKVIDDIHRAVQEVDQLRKRQARAQSTSLAAGLPAGRFLYGYRRIRDPRTGELLGQEPDPVEAPVVVELYRRVAAGESIWSILRDLEARGVVIARTTAGRMLRNLSYLGHRTHHGRVVVENAWPAIVDEVTFYRVQAIVSDPTRRKSRTVANKHLLAGLISCAVCGGRCTLRLGRARNETQYRCKDRGCVAVDAKTLEAGVRLLIAEALARPDALMAFVPRPAELIGARADLKAIQARLDDADDALAAGELSSRAHGKLEARLRPRLDELTAQVARAKGNVPLPVAALAAHTADDVAARFDALVTDDLVAARLVVRSLLTGCVLRPAPNRQRRTDLGLRFRWAGMGDEIEV